MISIKLCNKLKPQNFQTVLAVPTQQQRRSAARTKYLQPPLLFFFPVLNRLPLYSLSFFVRPLIVFHCISPLSFCSPASVCACTLILPFLVAPCPPLSPLFFVCSNAQQTLRLYRNVEKLFCLEHFSDNAPLFNAPIT